MQKTDFRHYDQSTAYEADLHRAVLWLPRRSTSDTQSARRYAAKLLSGIYRNNGSANLGDFAEIRK